MILGKISDDDEEWDRYGGLKIAEAMVRWWFVD